MEASLIFRLIILVIKMVTYCVLTLWWITLHMYVSCIIIIVMTFINHRRIVIIRVSYLGLRHRCSVVMWIVMWHLINVSTFLLSLNYLCITSAFLAECCRQHASWKERFGQNSLQLWGTFSVDDGPLWWGRYCNIVIILYKTKVWIIVSLFWSMNSSVQARLHQFTELYISVPSTWLQ